MDHIRLPRSPVHPPVEVPYLCTEKYDGGPFLTYPHRQGWSEQDIYYRPNWAGQHPYDGNKLLSRRPLAEVTSFLQNWLCFGLLATVFSPELDDFVRCGNDEQEFVTTSSLPAMATGLVEREKERKMDHGLAVMMEERQRHLDQCLKLAHEVFNFINIATTLDPIVLLSIGALGEYLTNIRNLVFYDPEISESRLLLNWPTGCFQGEADFLKRRMLQDGWCESEVRMIYDRCSPSAKYFISNLDRPGPEKDHRARCTRMRCVAYKTDDSNYRTEHVEEGCDCKHVYANQQQLYSILQSGTVPLISTALAFDDQLPIEIVPATAGIKYVAVSHVWSDGLGDPVANSLPRCQLVHISHLVNALYGPADRPIPFWMDTLCCPREPRDATHLAIQYMRKTYSEADKVLVLEKYLRSHPVEAMSAFERMARIFCSSWTLRLWTFQEGVLAKSLFIQFADTALEFYKAFLAMVYDDGPHFERHSLSGFYTEIRSRRPITGSAAPFEDLQELVVALKERSTTVSSDEVLCLGTMMDLDMEKLLEVGPAARMQRFWSLQSADAANLIFWTGRRLEDRGYRWAPASFVDQALAFLPGGTDPTMRPMARRTALGLMVKFPGVVLGTLQGASIARRFWLRDEGREWRYWMACTVRRDGGDEQEGIVCSGSSGVSDPVTFALIFRQPPSMMRFDPLGFASVCATLVSIRKRTGEVIYARFENTGNLFMAVDGQLPREQLPSAFALKDELVALCESQMPDGKTNMSSIVIRGQHRVFDGEWLSQDQQWCVD